MLKAYRERATDARVGVDIGGTFTDLVLRDDAANRLVVAKVLSTYPDPANGAMRGFDVLLENADVEAADISYFVHASTVATNLVLERKGGRAALITTHGFRDVLHLQRQKRADLYDLFYDKPAPLIDRRDIHEVPERILADGSVLLPLDEAATARTLHEIADQGIEAVGVVLLHSYANPAHERRVREIAASETPDLMISLSTDLSPKWREYERSSTTAINAYVSPRTARYLAELQAALRKEGMSRPFHVMQCNGGIALVGAMKRTPVFMIESGPAAGALMAGFVGRICNRQHIIAFDVGGTTAKASIVERGEPALVEDFEVGRVTRLRVGSGLPVSVPAIDLVEIGVGGGSIARVQNGVLAVGPTSAGAAPGPACYGFGGAEPTLTDANVVLGYLDPEYFLGGKLKLDLAAARTTVADKIAAPLGISVEEAAYAIHAVANSSMASAMSIVTTQRGLDPRDFAVVAFGGAGPSHAALVAEELSIGEVIVPVHAGVASAVGLLVAPYRLDFTQTLLTRLDAANVDRFNCILAELEEQGRQSLAESALDYDPNRGWRMVRQARVRYVGQGYEISVALPAGELGLADLEAIRESFLGTYRQLYGFADPHGALEVVDWRLTILGPLPDATLPAVESGAPRTEGPEGSRRAFFPSAGGFVETPVWSRYRLTPEIRIAGPAIIQERESTTVLPPGVTAGGDSFGNLILTTRARGALR